MRFRPPWRKAGAEAEATERCYQIVEGSPATPPLGVLEALMAQLESDWMATSPPMPFRSGTV